MYTNQKSRIFQLKKHIIAFVFLASIFIPLNAQYSIHSKFGDLTECSTATQGPFIIWWDKDSDYSADANRILDILMSVRTETINDLGMQDPPNAKAGAYVNIYVKNATGYFSKYDEWACGVGTEQDGTPYRGPYLACTAYHLRNSDKTVAHEGFHFMQYSSTSPGFVYSGNSGWYTEASANYYSVKKFPDETSGYTNAFILRKMPHLPLWLGWGNLGDSSYPNNWQRQVHQYGIHMFMLYMTNEKNVPANIFTDGYYNGTSLLPQEYISSKIGISNFRNYFIDFAAELHNNYSFLTEEQISGASYSWNLSSDPEDVNEFVLTLNNKGTNGWFRPDNDIATTGWSFNTYRLLTDTKTTTYTFKIKGDATGTFGDPSYFKGKILVKNKSGGVTYHDVPMSNDQEGSISINLSDSDIEIDFIVASLPNKLRDDNAEFQVYPYEIQIIDENPNCNWTTIAEENETMSFTGTKTIRYGAKGIYNTLTVPSGTVCGNKVFGDPVPNVLKTCEECPESSSAVFIPDPNKTYYIDAPYHNLRLAADGGSESPYTTSTSTTGADVEWKFVDKGNGFWHIQRAAGGTLPRLRTDNDTSDGTAAGMQSTGSNGAFTYFDFEEGAIEGTYFITLPGGPEGYVRLQIDRSKNVQMVEHTRNGTWESFKITEVQNSGAPIGQTIWLKSLGNGKYVQRNETSGRLEANASSEQDELVPFIIEDAEDGMVALKSGFNGKYVVADIEVSEEVAPLYANRGALGDWEKFTWINNPDGTISLKANANAKYVCADKLLGDNWPLAANRGVLGNWEKFYWGTYSAAKELTALSNVVIYPNPVVSTTTINNAAGSTLNVYNMNGSVVFTTIISSESETIDLSKLAIGIYYTEVIGATESCIVKLVKN